MENINTENLKWYLANKNKCSVEREYSLCEFKNEANLRHVLDITSGSH